MNNVIVCMLIIGAASVSACGGAPSGPKVYRLVLTDPVVVDISAMEPNAFVDRNGEPWFYISSPGSGDSPEADKSETRLSFTMSHSMSQIDNKASAAMLFRTTGYFDCDEFSGSLRLIGDHPWSIEIDARCLLNEGYNVRGTMYGYY